MSEHPSEGVHGLLSGILTGILGNSEHEVSEDESVFPKLCAYEEFRRRFSNTEIHVYEYKGMPTQVWYQNGGETHLRKDCKCVVKTMMKSLSQILPAPFCNKWSSPTKEKCAYLHFAELHIDFLARRLIMSYSGSTPHWKRICQLPKIKAEKKHLTDNEHLRILDLTYEKASVDLFCENVLLAFLYNMQDSAGRDGISAILDLACKVVFGPGFPSDSKVRVIATGTAPFEGFPVNIVELPVVRGLLQLQSQFKKLTMGADCEEHDETVSTESSIDSSESYKRYDCSDLLVTSVDDNGWTKFLLVCDVVAGNQEFSTCDKAHLIRQMCAACMHQSEVFGLLINARYAKLARLVECDKELFRYDLVQDYIFANPTAFEAPELKRLFRDLVLILDFAQENIIKIEPIPHRLI